MENKNRVARIQAKVDGEKVLISELDVQIRDPGIKQLLRHAADLLDDVERFFLGQILQESRIITDETRWLFYTELALQNAIQQRRLVQNIIDKFGMRD